MEQKFVKRNYLFFTYQILKRESKRNGKHFTAEQLVDEIKRRYGATPNRKTIYTVIDDLVKLGFDIKLQKDSLNKGYYLDERQVSFDDFILLIDGISSLKYLDIDWKLDFIENLSNVLGYRYDEINWHEYDSRYPNISSILYNDKLNKDEEESKFSELIKTNFSKINEAIANKKKLKINFGFTGCENYLLKDEDELIYSHLRLKHNQDMLITPYHIFRNMDNELYLLFFIKLNQHTYVFAAPILELLDFEISEEKADRVDGTVVNLNVDNFVNAFAYREALRKETHRSKIKWSISFGYHEDSELYKLMKLYTETSYSKDENGVEVKYGSYKDEDEDDLIEIAIQNADVLTIYPGSAVYDELQYLGKSLANTYGK